MIEKYIHNYSDDHVLHRFIFPRNILNPFKLPYSRNILIRPNKEIDTEAIFNLPIAFSDQYVDVVDEEYVLENCSEIKFTYK